MAEEAEKLSIPLIHYSTDYVFDGKKTIPYTEEDEPNPINMYGESKLLGEQAIQETLERQLILRTSWVYSHRGNNFLNTILRLLQERDEIKVVDDQIGAPTSARLIAESTEKLLRNSIQGYGDLIRGTYHLTAGGSTSWYGFAREILTTLNASIKTSILPISSSEYVVKARRPSMSVLDNHKMISNTDVGQPDWKHDMVLEMSLNFMI